MKRIILMLAFVISTICTFAQDPVKVNTYKNRYGAWSTERGHYVFEDYNYTTITFSFYDEYISVNDMPHSIYRITEYLAPTDIAGVKVTKVKCLDEQNRICLIFLSSSSDLTDCFIRIYYNEFSLQYMINFK